MGDNSIDIQGRIMVHLFCPSPHLSISQVLMLMPLVVLKLFAVQGTGWTETDVPTLHSMSYFADTDAFMSLHKPIITLFLTPKIPF